METKTFTRAQAVHERSVRMLDISIDHVRRETHAWIDRDLDDPFGATSGVRWADCGWIFFVTTDESELKRMPDDLRAVLRFARVCGFEYLKLDCGSGAVRGIPLYQDGD